MCHSTRTAIKSRGIITSLNRPALGKEPSFRLLSDRFGIALHPSAQTYSLAMLGSMEPDPIAGFMHVANIVIIPSGLRKCRALEWLQIISRNNWDRLVIPTVIYEWWLTVCAIWGLLYIRIYDYIFLADQHVVCLYLAHSLGENQTLYSSLMRASFCTSFRAACQKVSSTAGCVLRSESSRFNGLLKMGSENWDREVSRL